MASSSTFLEDSPKISSVISSGISKAEEAWFGSATEFFVGFFLPVAVSESALRPNALEEIAKSPSFKCAGSLRSRLGLKKKYTDM